MDGRTYVNLKIPVPIGRAGNSRFFRAFALASAKLKKSANARRKKSAKKSESAKREGKKREFALFLVFAEHRTGSPVPGPDMANLGGGTWVSGRPRPHWKPGFRA